MEAAAAARHLEIVLLHEINAGTFARLYLAEARAPGGLDRIVAVKILREQWSDSKEIVTRTRDEARLLARLRHKNILRVEDLAEVDRQLAIIMEFVDGLDLKQLVEAVAPNRIPARATFQIIQEVAGALDAAYAKVPYGLDRPLRVVHRDIKPGNIMVSVEGEVKVLDFGTARSNQVGRGAKTDMLRFGSLKYMSPERREGERGEHASDIYALGQTLYELLTGVWMPMLPMELAEHDEDIGKLLQALPVIGMASAEWEKALRQVLRQMLAGDPALRPTAEQVVKLMRAFGEQAPGKTLDAWAHDEVVPLTRKVRGSMHGGTMAGRSFTVDVRGSDPGGSGTLRRSGARLPDRSLGGASPIAPPKGLPPAPPPANRPPVDGTAEVARIGKSPPTTAPRPFPEPTPPRPRDPTRATYEAPAALKPSFPAPRRPEPPARAPVGPDDPPTIMEPAIRPKPAAAPPPAPPLRPAPATENVAARVPPPAPRPAPPAARPAPAPIVEPVREEPPTPGRSLVPILMVVAMLLMIGLAVVALASVAIFYWYTHTSDVTSTPAPAPAPAPAAVAAPAATGTAPVSVKLDGVSVQWVRLTTVVGEVVGRGTTGLDAKVAPDTYLLTMKQVGHPEIGTELNVAASGVTLVCKQNKDDVSCTGAGPALVLKRR